MLTSHLKALHGENGAGLPVNKAIAQGGDSAAGTQALPVGKIIDDKVCRKDN